MGQIPLRSLNTNLQTLSCSEKSQQCRCLNCKLITDIVHTWDKLELIYILTYYVINPFTIGTPPVDLFLHSGCMEKCISSSYGSYLLIIEKILCTELDSVNKKIMLCARPLTFEDVQHHPRPAATQRPIHHRHTQRLASQIISVCVRHQQTFG